jgi:hypothetical protein
MTEVNGTVVVTMVGDGVVLYGVAGVVDPPSEPASPLIVFLLSLSLLSSP